MPDGRPDRWQTYERHSRLSRGVLTIGHHRRTISESCPAYGQKGQKGDDLLDTSPLIGSPYPDKAAMKLDLREVLA